MTGSVVRALRGWATRVRPRVAIPALVVVLALAGAGLWWVQRPYASDLADLADGSPEAAAPGLAARSLARLREAVRSGDVTAARDLAPSDDPVAADLLEAIVDNGEALRVEGLGLRYVDEVPAPEGTPPGQWPAAVELTWRFAGFDTGPTTVETVVSFDREGDRVAIAGLGAPPETDEPFASSGAGSPDDVRTPLWLTGPVAVRRGAESLVLAASAAEDDLDTYADLAASAVTTVAPAVPDWDRRLVVEVPEDVPAFAAAVGSEEEAVATAAAVTSTGDGSSGAEAGAVHVYVNRAVLDTLGPRGMALVMDHEAVHVATRAPGSPAPTWLVEGYADYVALRGADIPLRRAAAQVAERVRQDGAPEALPTPEDFDLTGTHAGATYEAAWLACVVLAEAAGPSGLRRVYDAANRGVGLDQALASATDLDVAGLTRRWQDRLREVAAATEGAA